MRNLLVVIAAALFLEGCGTTLSPGGSGPTAVPGQPAATPGQGAAAVVLHDQDNGRTVSVRKGAHLTIELGSTYWTFDSSSNATVLRQAGQAQVRPSARCVPGGGCGVVAAGFDALSAGVAVVSATRTSCGEALSCTGLDGTYRVSVVVVA
jgi:uncharacterized protein YceK